MLTVYLCVGMIIFVEVNHFSLGYGNAAWKFCRPLLLCALVLILPVRFMSCFVRDLQVLPEQLAHFSIRRTRCFCCDHEHKQSSDVDRDPVRSATGLPHSGGLVSTGYP